MDTGFLLVPRPGERTTHTLTRKVRLLALRHLLSVDRSSVGRSRALATLQRVLAQLAKRDPARLLDAIGRPDVLPLLLTSLAGLRPVGDCLIAAVPSLLAALGTTPEAVVWDVELSAIASGDRRWAFSPPAQGVAIDPSGLTVRMADGVVVELESLPATPVLALHHGVHLAVHDSFPLSMVEDHPDKSGNAVDLGGREQAEWAAALNQALELIQQGLPGWVEELPTSLARVVPVGFHAEQHLSASYREAPGIAWVSLHPDPLTMAEALVHETQHSKLNLLSWLDPVLHNGRSVWTESPVRPDLRPLMGVLLAAHAFVPVALLHRALASHPWADPGRFRDRRAEVLASNTRGLAVLDELAQPSDLGKRLLHDLHTMHALAQSPPS